MRIQIPTTCPVCDYPLETVNEQLFCRNTACGARLDKQIEHFAKVLGIKGLGEKTVQKLNLADVTELYYLDRDQLVEDLGSAKVADKLLQEIELSKSADLATVIHSFGIQLIGGSASSKICSVVNHIDEITEEKCKEAGLGEKATLNLMSWLNTEFEELRQFLPFSFNSSKTTSSVNTNGKTICITGKLSSFKTKSEAYKVLECNGYKVVETVNKSLQFLVDEENKGSSKRKKAEELGITIISNLESFIKEN